MVVLVLLLQAGCLSMKTRWLAFAVSRLQKWLSVQRVA